MNPVILSVAFFAVAACVVVYAMRAKPRASGDRRARAGHVPYPAATIVDLPGGALRLIDLRPLPARDLDHGRLGVVRAQLGLEQPCQVQVWVVELATARAWLALGTAVLELIAGRLTDPRNPSGQNLVHTTGGVLADAEIATMQASGVHVALAIKNAGDSRDAIALLPTPERWRSTPEDRPIAEYETVSTGPHEGVLIHVIREFAYIDLRRAVPEAIRNGVALDRIDTMFDPMLARFHPTHLVWVVAPWVLELLTSDHVARIETLVDRARSLGQRLAIVTRSGEPPPQHELLRRLGSRLTPLTESFEWTTADRGTFVVAPLDALHDAYFTHARAS